MKLRKREIEKESEKESALNDVGREKERYV